MITFMEKMIPLLETINRLFKLGTIDNLRILRGMRILFCIGVNIYVDLKHSKFNSQGCSIALIKKSVINY